MKYFLCFFVSVVEGSSKYLEKTSTQGGKRINCLMLLFVYQNNYSFPDNLTEKILHSNLGGV